MLEALGFRAIGLLDVGRHGVWRTLGDFLGESKESKEIESPRPHVEGRTVVLYYQRTRDENSPEDDPETVFRRARCVKFSVPQQHPVEFSRLTWSYYGGSPWNPPWRLLLGNAGLTC